MHTPGGACAVRGEGNIAVRGFVHMCHALMPGNNPLNVPRRSMSKGMKSAIPIPPMTGLLDPIYSRWFGQGP